MKIRLTKKISLFVAIPMRLVLEKQHQLELKLRENYIIKIPQLPLGFQLRTYKEEDEVAVITLLSRAGINLSSEELRIAFETCLPEGCFLVEEERGNVVSMMMARHINSNGELFSGRIDWLATDPDFTGLGLGTVSASSAAKRLKDAGYNDIWVTTDDHRLGAIKIFYKIGFRPHIYDEIKDRWQKIIKILDIG
ncbi:GNAT family N-acetyltransferase [Gammaproteobacteria bacterium]|nr:GNAT family N-acetyltransferase [Gammaproteobacteria bacterium]